MADSSNWYLADPIISSCFLDNKEYFYEHGKNDIQEKFCSGWVYPHQWINCITDFWIIGMAFWQLTWDHNYPMLRFVAACIAINGIGSFGNHYLGTRQWMIMDNSSMYIELWITATIIWNHTYRHQSYFLNTNKLDKSDAFGRPCVKSILWIICCLSIWFLIFRDLTGCKWVGAEIWFIIGFALPLISLIINWILFVRKLHNNPKIIHDLPFSKDILKRSQRYMKIGVIVSSISAVIWFLIELPCKSNKLHWMGYIPGHSIWHIGMSYGLSLFILWFICCISILEESHFEYKTINHRIIKCFGKSKAANQCNCCLQKVFPIITTNPSQNKKFNISDSIVFCRKCCCEKFPNDETINLENVIKNAAIQNNNTAKNEQDVELTVR